MTMLVREEDATDEKPERVPSRAKAKDLKYDDALAAS